MDLVSFNFLLYLFFNFYFILYFLLLVPSENKKDLRSIEQTLADIREKKRMKMENESSQSQSSKSN